MLMLVHFKHFDEYIKHFDEYIKHFDACAYASTLVVLILK